MDNYDETQVIAHLGSLFEKSIVPSIGSANANSSRPGDPPSLVEFSNSEDVANPIVDESVDFFANILNAGNNSGSTGDILNGFSNVHRFVDQSRPVLFSERSANSAQQQQEILSNVLGTNETVEDVLKRTSYIWEQRLISAKEFEALKNIPLGDNYLYEQMYIDFREKRLKSCFPGIWSKQHNARLPAPAVGGEKWFHEKVVKFPHVPTSYSNLTYFGNVMAHMANDFTIIANPGLNMETMMLVRIACLAAPEFNEGQSLYILLAGDASVGKSFVMTKNKEMLPPNWVNMVSHLSTMALTSDSNEDMGVLMIEETPANMTQETAERTGHDNGASFLKTLLTNKICQTRTVSVENGQRKKCVHVTSKMMTGVFATNGKLDLNSPLLKRYLVIKPSHDPLISEKINKLGEMNVDEELQNALLRQKVIAHLVQQTQLAIAMGCIKPPNMDAFTMLFADVVRSMRSYGHPMTEAKSVNNVAAVVRTLVVMRAVCEACLSEKNVHLRVDLETNTALSFRDKYLQHFANIEALLVAQEPEIIFGISMCHTVFGDDTEGKVIEAAKNLCGIEIVDGKYIFTKEPRFLPTEAVMVGNEKRVQTKRHYVEMLPLEGRGLDRLLYSLCAHCFERPSRANVNTAIQELGKKNLKHKMLEFFQDGETKFGHLEVVPNSIEQISPIIVKRWVSDNFEKNLISEDKNHQKEQNNARYYILVPALLEFVSQSEAMRKSLEALQHIGTIEANHLINMPLRARRTKNPKSPIQPFYGIFEMLKFKPREHLLSYKSHNALLQEQFNQLSSTAMFDFGNQELPRSVEQRDAYKEATRKRAKSVMTPVRVITSSVDYASYMNRQQVCAASHEDVDVYYWPYFVKACLEMRRQMPKVFGDTQPKIYPDALLEQAQHRNAICDLPNTAAPIEEKLKYLARVTDLNGRNVNKKQPPSEYHLHNLFKQESGGGLRALRLAFASTSTDMSAAPVLSESSRRLIETSVDGNENWKVVCTIFSEYKNAEKTSKTFLKYCDLNMELLPPTPEEPTRKVANLTRRFRDEPNVVETSRLLKRTFDESSSDRLLLSSSSSQPEQDQQQHEQQKKKTRAEDESALTNPTSTNSTSSTSNITNYELLFERSKQFTFFDGGTIELKQAPEIYTILDTYPEQKEQNSNFDPSLLNLSTSKVLPQNEQIVNPFTGGGAFRRSAM